MSKEYSLTTPLREDDVRKLNVRDIVYLSGRIYGIRDATQRRIFKEHVPPPVGFRRYPCLHTAPNVRKVGDRYLKICIGTTTSARMEEYTPKLIGEYGVSAIIGKGGLLKDSLKAMQEYGAVYLAVTGGAAALQTTQIEEIENTYWEDLFPECIWQLRAKNLGPLIVAMDSHGESLYLKVKKRAQRRLPRILKEIGATT